MLLKKCKLRKISIGLYISNWVQHSRSSRLVVFGKRVEWLCKGIQTPC